MQNTKMRAILGAAALGHVCAQMQLYSGNMVVSMISNANGLTSAYQQFSLAEFS